MNLIDIPQSIPKRDPFRIYLWLLLLGLIIGCGRYQTSGYTSSVHSLSASEPLDSGLLAVINPYKENLEKAMNTVIGQSKKALDTKGVGETTLGNLVADLQKEFAEEKFGQAVDVSVMNNGGLRNSLPSGDITLGNLYELSPFENYLYLLEMDGQSMTTLATYAAAKKNLGLSGLTLVAEQDRLLSFEINGSPVDPTKTYTLAISDYLANGGDYMGFLTEQKRLITSDVLIRDLLIYKIKELHASGILLDAEIEGRQTYH